MGTTAQKLQAILDSKEAIRQSIIAKGVAVSESVEFDEYNTKISEIPVGSSGAGTGDYNVKYLDYNGNIIMEKNVDSGESVTPPDPITHDYLIFYGWTKSGNNITCDKLIGAQYTTVDNKTYAFVTVTVLTGLSPIIYLSNLAEVPLSVDWGDGTAPDTTSAIGLYNPTHTYDTAGHYLITITGASCQLASTAGALFGALNYKVILDKIYISALHTLYTNTFSNHWSLRFVVISYGITLLNGTFNVAKSLSCAILPNSIIDAGPSTFSSAGALECLVMSSNTVTVKSTFLRFCGALSYIKIPPLVTLLEDRCLSENQSLLTIEMEPTTPPTMAVTRVFENIPLGARIYVPDASLTAYKEATNWASFANYIYPISLKPLHNE